jgi:hypothetical protein
LYTRLMRISDQKFIAVRLCGCIAGMHSKDVAHQGGAISVGRERGTDMKSPGLRTSLGFSLALRLVGCRAVREAQNRK